ncbi:hypothetical protein Tco_0742721 [Tanacetum coccineum]
MELFCFVDDVFNSEYVHVQVMVQQVKNWKHVYASKGEFVRVSLLGNCTGDLKKRESQRDFPEFDYRTAKKSPATVRPGRPQGLE